VRRVLRDDGTCWVNLGDSYASGGRGCGQAGPAGEKQRSNVGALLGPKRAPEGLKDKDLVGIPWRVAFALQADGWWLRSDIIWAKPNPMPESVTDRPTKSHEYLFLLTKSARYYFDAQAIAEEAIHAGRVVEYDGTQKNCSAGDGVNGRETTFGANGPQRIEVGPTRNARSVWTIATSPYPDAHFATFPPELPRRCILAGSKPGDTVLDPFAGAGTTGLVADRLGRSFIGCELNPAYVTLARRRIAADCPLFAQEQG
jgi:DNA modification methylase